MSGMTEKQRRFVEAYLIDPNATWAAKQAGYSENSAYAQGHALLKNPQVRMAVGLAQEERAERVKIDADLVLQELVSIATVDIAEAFNEHGQLKPIHEIPPQVRKAIAGIDVFEEFAGRGEDRECIGQVRKVKFWDKPKSLELIGKHLKLWVERMELSGQVDLAQRIVKARKRTADE